MHRRGPDTSLLSSYYWIVQQSLSLQPTHKNIHLDHPPLQWLSSRTFLSPMSLQVMRRSLCHTTSLLGGSSTFKGTHNRKSHFWPSFPQCRLFIASWIHNSYPRYMAYVPLLSLSPPALQEFMRQLSSLMLEARLPFLSVLCHKCLLVSSTLPHLWIFNNFFSVPLFFIFIELYWIMNIWIYWIIFVYFYRFQNKFILQGYIRHESHII